MSALTLDPLGAFPPLQDPGGLEWYKSTRSKIYTWVILFTLKNTFQNFLYPGGIYIYIQPRGYI